MASSRLRGPLCTSLMGYQPFAEELTGPIGVRFNEFGIRNSPGTLGYNDWAGFVGSVCSLASPATATGTCACNRDMTLDELCAIFAQRKREICEKYLPYLNATFKAYEISTCLRKAHFLAQVADESAELHYTSEVLPKGKKESQVYDGYKGRGLIQITWKRNYKAYGEAVHHDFLGKHKTDLEKPEWATDSAGWYWTEGSSEDLNDLADKNDLLEITALVNGAFNGFEDRRKHFEAAKKTLGVNDCKTANVGKDPYKPFKDSEVHENRVQSFAWGAWNDPKTGKKGVVASADARKEGYLRYLELLKELEIEGKKETKHHFGFSPEKMKSLAEEGSK
jgi:predicted chitinase